MKDGIPLIFERIDQLVAVAELKKKASAFFVQFFPSARDEYNDRKVLAPRNRETLSNVLGFCEIGNVATLKEIGEYVDGKVDHLFIDVDQKLPGLEGVFSLALSHLKKTMVHPYSNSAAWANSLFAFALALSPPAPGKKVLLVGDHPLAFRLASALVNYSYDVYVHSPSQWAKLSEVVAALNLLKNKYEKALITPLLSLSPARARPVGLKFDVVVAAEPSQEVLTPEILELIEKDGILIDGGIGSISAETTRAARARGTRVYRIDNRTATPAIVQSALETLDLIKNRMGRETIAGVSVVAGGVMGLAGDVIVDSISNPSAILGVADGAGKALREEDITEFLKERMAKIQALF